MRNFLSAGAGYLAEKGEAGFERGNVHRGVEDITFSLISSPDKSMPSDLMVVQTGITLPV